MDNYFFDFDDGDFAFSISDYMAMDSEGNLLMKIGSNMEMDMDSGEVHLTSEWPSEENNDYNKDKK